MVSNKASTLSATKLAELREKAKKVRAAVEQDREQIEAEGIEALKQATAAGKLTRVAAVFRAEEQFALEAMDAYAAKHGLTRSQVLRVGLEKLLKIQLPESKRGWAPGRLRSAHDQLPEPVPRSKK